MLKHPHVCHLHPPNSRPHTLKTIYAAILEEEINLLLAQGHVVVCGDFNARAGQQPDMLSTQGNNHLPGSRNIISSVCHPRHNYDPATNKSGSPLLQLCRTLSLLIINGRLRGDLYGRYTYSSPLGNSTIDYFITDLNLESLRVFTISPLTPLSDHTKLQFTRTEQQPIRKHKCQLSYIILKYSTNGKKMVQKHTKMGIKPKTETQTIRTHALTTMNHLNTIKIY